MSEAGFEDALCGFMAAAETVLLGRQYGSAGFCIVGEYGDSVATTSISHYRADGSVFYPREGDLTDELADDLEELVRTVSRAAGDRAALVLVGRAADRQWSSRVFTGADAARWQVTPATSETLAAEVCPL